MTSLLPRDGLGDPVRLSAGRLDLELRGTDLARIRWYDREVVSRVYVAVRDEAWSTVLPELIDMRVEPGPESFAVRMDVRHRHGAIDFEWHGTMTAAADGRLDYVMQGRALRAFRYGRIGLCILHAAEDYAGKPFVAQSGGSAVQGVLPVEIAPQHYRDGRYEPLVSEFETLRVQLSRNIRVEFAFEGDLFEIEDQRNWTDASFKTYSTPLRLGYPHHAAAGQRLHQRMTARMVGCQPPAGPTRRPRPTNIAVGDWARCGLPRVGTSVPVGTGERVPPQARALLRKVGLAHVRVDVRAGSNDAPTVLQRGIAFARHANAAVELALHANPQSAWLSSELFQLMPAGVPLARVIVLDEDEEVTQPAAVRAVRRCMRAIGVSAPVGGGTGHWFAELNRNPPDTSDLEFLAYGLCPQLHIFDDAALMETLSVQGMTVASAQSFGGRPVVLGPVVLMPAVGGAVGGSTGTGEGIDPRQRSLLCAAWTLGSLTQLARAGAESVTYFEALGPRGLIGTGSRNDRSGTRSAGPWPYPVHQMLAEVGRIAGGSLRETDSSEPLAAAALACSDGRRFTVLVANLRPRPHHVTIEGLPSGIATIRVIGLAAGAAACDFCGPLTHVITRAMMRGLLRLELGPYGFARVAVRIAVPDHAAAPPGPAGLTVRAFKVREETGR